MTTPAVSAAAARSHALADRNIVLNVELNRRHLDALCLRHGLSRLPDQVIGAGGNGWRITAPGPDTKGIALLETAGQVYAECQTERIKARAEIGARSGHT